MAKAMMKYSNSVPQAVTMQAMPEVTKSTTLAALVGPDSWTLLNLLNAKSTTLAALVGPDSWTLLNLLNADCSFLTKNPKCWEQDSSYIACKKTAQEINVVNDASERALGLLTAFNNEKITRNNQKEIVWKMVSKVRRMQSNTDSSSERVTKKNFLKMDFSFFHY